MATVPIPRRRPLTSLRHDPSAIWHHIDAVLVACLVAVAGLGVLMVYSATRGASPPYDGSYLTRQAFFVVIGLIACAVVAVVDYHKVLDQTPLIYGSTIVLLVAVRLVGSRRSGTQGWFQLGPFQLQPSEFAKLALILGFVYLATQFHGDIDLRRLGALLGLCALPIVLVLLQPDLGTSLVSVAVTFCLLVAAGVRGRYLVLLGVASVLLATLVLTSGVLDDYQKARLTVFANQESESSLEDQRGDAYNLEQSKLAIGSGGVRGTGLFNGPQTRSERVPEQHTDFIFTVVGEELGLIGAGALLSAYAVIVWRIWRTAQLARDDAGSMICLGVLAMFVFQIFQNVGMTMGIMPITGIPLPFLSYGGSSTIMAFIAMGLVLNIHMRRFR
ncbi:rod shape-determining protein RodA [Iamia sp. SCSIO 61187]|uniref:rod shape-determining protein RodA n=1 Tax=Iamia sp. SCSIO 61187 TaxID=2722752 RepID=UPI001C637E78|nr:rod shape-determining protein RodA [Iamia sp. SCSIO 61187]QYG92520.1 rod shape-determining protein RodA [Iamia sp. SCSIO 61187]